MSEYTTRQRKFRSPKQGPLKQAGRVALDVTVALAFFTSIAMCSGSDPLAASPNALKAVPIMTAAVTQSVAMPTDDMPMMQVASATVSAALRPSMQETRDKSNRLLLALILSMLVAMNLAFFRHLRRAYASPRRSGRRG